MPNAPRYPDYPSSESSFPNMQDVDHLVLKVLEAQENRQKRHQLQEELNWERDKYEGLQGERHKHKVNTSPVTPSLILKQPHCSTEHQ